MCKRLMIGMVTLVFGLFSIAFAGPREDTEKERKAEETAREEQKAATEKAPQREYEQKRDSADKAARDKESEYKERMDPKKEKQQQQ